VRVSDPCLEAPADAAGHAQVVLELAASSGRRFGEVRHQVVHRAETNRPVPRNGTSTPPPRAIAKELREPGIPNAVLPSLHTLIVFGLPGLRGSRVPGGGQGSGVKTSPLVIGKRARARGLLSSFRATSKVAVFGLRVQIGVHEQSYPCRTAWKN